MKVEEWFVKNRFKYKSFSHIKRLVKFKKKQKETVSVLIPTLNEERTIGKIVRILKENLMDKHGLIDEIIVIDSNSSDRTREIAKENGATVYIDSHILKKRGNWKRLKRRAYLISIENTVHAQFGKTHYLKWDNKGSH